MRKSIYPRTSKHCDAGDIILLDGTEYLVEEAALGGGGTGHGPHDVFPDGWRLSLRRLKKGEYDPKGLLTYRYQSGCFVDEVMLPEATVVGYMRKTWVREA